MFHKQKLRQSTAPARSAPSALTAAGLLLIAFAGCSTITALRVIPILSHPALGWDERIIFSDFYSGKGGFLYLYPDYISLSQNIMFVLAFKLFKTSNIPAALCYAAFTVSTCGMSLLSLPMFRGIIRSDAARVWTCFLLAALPLGNAALTTAPAYQNWTCLAINCLIACGWLSSYRSREWPISYVMVIVLTVCTLSQPLSVCLSPIYAAVVWKARSRKDTRTQCIASLLFALSIFAAAEAFTLGRGAAHAEVVSYRHILASMVRAIPFALDRGLLEGFTGAHWREIAIDNLPSAGPGLAPVIIYFAAVVVLAGLLGACWLTEDGEVCCFVISSLFSGLCLALFVLPALELARPGFSSGMLTGLSRYWFAQHVIAVTAFISLAWSRIDRDSNGEAGASQQVDDKLAGKPPGRWAGHVLRSPVRATFLAAFLALWLAFANIGQAVQFGGAPGDWVKMSLGQQTFLRWVAADEAFGETGCREQGPKEPEPRLRLVLPMARGLVATPCLVYPSTSP